MIRIQWFAPAVIQVRDNVLCRPGVQCLCTAPVYVDLRKVVDQLEVYYIQYALCFTCRACLLTFVQAI